MINQRGNLPIIVGLLILILVIGGGIYFLSKQENSSLSPVSSPIPSDSSDSVINWKPFEDKLFGIAFSFPPELIPVQQLINPQPETMAMLIDFRPSNTESNEKSSAKLFYISNPNNLSLEALDKKLAGDVGGSVSLVSPDDTKITNPNGIVANYSKQHNCVSACSTYTWINNDQVFQLVYYPQPNKPNQAQDLEKIFSSFRHLN